MTQVPKIKPADIVEAGMLDYHLSIPDMSAPSVPDIDRMIAFIAECLLQDKPVGVSCDGGYGRTGCLLSCFFITRGMEPLAAISYVKEKRPGSVLTDEQDQAVYKFAEAYQAGSGKTGKR
jgi:protein-tyrosine phosphatase